jgi:hypothetical protein
MLVFTETEIYLWFSCQTEAYYEDKPIKKTGDWYWINEKTTKYSQ